MRVDNVINTSSSVSINGSSFTTANQSAGSLESDFINVDSLTIDASFLLAVTPKGGGSLVDVLIPKGFSGQIDCPSEGPAFYRGISGAIPTAGVVVLQGVKIGRISNDA